MKVCTALPRSSARINQRICRHARWKQILRRASTERRRNDASPIVTANAAAHPRPSIDPDNKTVATAVGDLPLSPVMDPSYWEATTRHQAPKPKGSKAQNSVERQFRKNPFAKALATPVRHCSATRTRFPAFFLQDFNLVTHPETGRPWWVPRSLAWDQPAECQQADGTERKPCTGEGELYSDQENVGTDGGESTVWRRDPKVNPSVPVKSKDVKPYGPSAYVLARRDLISAFTTKGSGYERHPGRLFGGTTSRYARFAGSAVWREDMDSLILHRMRRGIIDDLLYLSRLCAEDSRHYIVECHGWDDVQHKHQGAVLWFSNPAEPDETAEPRAQPGPFSIYNISNNGANTCVAVHNMPMLLGVQGAAEIRQNAAILAGGSLFMLAGRRTTNVQLKLWKLQGYLADYKENDDDQPQ
ncbi:hypothetical protein F5Y10DRAFT_244954 [Nemania abortiva]|nr:hypothetical protein F5Y10DRAFT_244954 [Nemania abortiva]